ncbi:MAG TPA: LCP family protein [Pseudonocardia sp.]|nr:LCP family protein [Pseudonocardia sp.]
MALVGRRSWSGSARRPRPVGIGRSLGAVAAAAAVPGLGHVVLGRRRTGAWVMGIFLVGAAATAGTAAHLGRAGLLRSVVSPGVLLVVSVLCVLVMIAWMAVVMWTFVATDPRARSPREQVLCATVAVTLCVGVAVPFGAAADLAYTQRALLDRVFSTDPAPGPAVGVPTGPVLPARMNILLLGSDAGPDRTGARTDTMIVASIDGRTAATTLFALPRNIQHAPFPPDSPAAARFPDGFHNPRAPASGDYLLNNVAEYGRAHPTLAPAGPTTDRGVNLLMSSITTMLGLPMNHYVTVNMDGLAALIDALGGVTVDVGPDPLPIGGVTYSGRHVTPDGYVPAGVQHLDGDQALWFARSRRNSDDYDRMGRQRCLIGALVAQKSPADVVLHFQQVTAAAGASVTTNIPRSLLPALLALADEHRPVLRSVAFDPDLPDPVADRGRFDPADPDVAFMRRVVRAALAPPVVPAPASAPVVPAPSSAPASRAPTATASGAPVPAPVSVASSCVARS